MNLALASQRSRKQRLPTPSSHQNLGHLTLASIIRRIIISGSVRSPQWCDTSALIAMDAFHHARVLRSPETVDSNCFCGLRLSQNTCVLAQRSLCNYDFPAGQIMKRSCDLAQIEVGNSLLRQVASPSCRWPRYSWRSEEVILAVSGTVLGSTGTPSSGLAAGILGA